MKKALVLLGLGLVATTSAWAGDVLVCRTASNAQDAAEQINQVTSQEYIEIVGRYGRTRSRIRMVRTDTLQITGFDNRVHVCVWVATD